MLRRYRDNKTGLYDQEELADIYLVSQFLHVRSLSGEKNITELERDYLIYCKKVFWHNTKYTNFIACANFLFIDMVYPLNKLNFFARWGIKIVTSAWIVKQGINMAYDNILEFPLMNEVIGGALIRYTEWIDIGK